MHLIQLINTLFHITKIYFSYINLFPDLPSRLGLYPPTAPLQRGKTPHTHTHKCPGYDTKQSDGEIPVMLELWGMWSTPSLPLLPGPLWPGVVAPDRALFMR